jgi:hypothetical protein
MKDAMGRPGSESPMRDLYVVHQQNQHVKEGDMKAAAAGPIQVTKQMRTS